MSALRVVQPDDDPEIAWAKQMQANHERLAVDDREQRAQIEQATDRLAVHESRFFRFQSATLDQIVGPVAPSEVAIIVGASGNGKTDAVDNEIFAQVAKGRRVYAITTEVPARDKRLMMAARACRLHPGDVLSGKAEHYRLDIVDALAKQNLDLLRLSSYGALTGAIVADIAKAVLAVEPHLVVIDHLDHVTEGANGSATGVSIDVIGAVHELAQRCDVPVLCTSQCNVHGRGGDRFASYRPVKLESVKYGGRKVEIASVVLGVYRPLKAGLTSADKKAVEDGHADDSTLLEPGAVSFNVLKCRSRGEAVGRRVPLTWIRGRILDRETGADDAQALPLR